MNKLYTIVAICLITLFFGFTLHIKEYIHIPIIDDIILKSSVNNITQTNRNSVGLKNVDPCSSDYKLNKYENSVLTYASQPIFSRNDFLQQIVGVPLKLERYYTNTQKLYFSYPSDYYNEAFHQIFLKNVECISYAKWNKEQNAQLLDGLEYTGKKRYFFSTPAGNLKVPESSKIKVQFNDIEYNIDLNEVHSYIINKVIYGGKLSFIIEQKYGRNIVSMNHGAFVSKPNEPSLSRLAGDITKSAKNQEEKIQLLLDFVTNEIEYNYREAYGNTETLKRANEILFSENSDCSGHVILFASLLEQVGADYKIVYLPSHIAVLVAGDFKNYNNMVYKIDGKKYYFSETTAAGFKIGKSTLSKPISVSDLLYLQNVSTISEIINIKNGKNVDFLWLSLTLDTLLMFKSIE